MHALSATHAAEQAWEALRPARWPLAPGCFPPGSALVGGAVRDALLQRLGPYPDLDMVIPQGAIKLCQRLAKKHRGTAVVLDRERDMARLVLGPWSLDLAAQEGPDLISDLQRRDYGINALALPLIAEAPLLDPTGGLDDLAKRQLRALSEANLLADPLRLLRGPRLAAELNFSLESTTAALISRHSAALPQVAAERVLAELEKLAGCPGGDAGLQQASDLGLLQLWERPLTAGAQGSLEVAGLSAEELRQALPLARLAQRFEGEALGQLKASRKLQQRCAVLRHWVEQISQPLEETAMLQLCRELQNDLPALVLLQPNATAGWLQRWRDRSDPLFHPRSPIDGRTLQRELGLAPGPQLGELMERLILERAFGRPHCIKTAKGLCRD
ncbi:CCA tRNA nucleotidyltransferase [Synechococcus sp. MIT S9452]|uniref:CCA tRNA nucleotidyltransferase n=1 Tax=Synechococcus sp. MIT S9452 TaxID=3082546 RepID=UPI0039A65479